MLLSGDVPLLTPATVRNLLDRHTATSAALTVLTAVVDNPAGLRPHRPVRRGDCTYCRGKGCQPSRARDSRDQFGHLCIRPRRAVRGGARHRRRQRAARVLPARPRPDLPGRGRIVEALTVANPQEVAGINSRSELAAVNRLMREAKNGQLMAEGVTIEDPATTYIDPNVQVGADTVIHPGVVARGQNDRRQRLRDPQLRPAGRRDDWRRRDHPQPLRDDRRHDWKRRRPSVRLPICTTTDDRREHEGRQFRRDEEDLARRTDPRRCTSRIWATR